jgi:hypothetical protein
LAATLLQAWIFARENRRVFIDPSQVHPVGLEHHLLGDSFPQFALVGRWGRAKTPINAAEVIRLLQMELLQVSARALQDYERQFVGVTSTGILGVGGHRLSKGRTRINQLQADVRSGIAAPGKLDALQRFFNGKGSYKSGSLKAMVAGRLFALLFPHARNLAANSAEVETQVAQNMAAIRSTIEAMNPGP